MANPNDGSRLGQPKNVATNANIAAVTGLKTMKDIVHSVCISSGSAHKILTQQLKRRKVCARCVPIA